ncbi:hypothetical protein AVEN_100000-1 [Araneus ventricosus]|uniref:Uncharacterized protein n=1 Tax=Araneus ventricosus TaxID=182803 RepID=A0A4Y2WQ96_ARAVE|nr:hypothetical protein AVEN_100000-1 [Araneus ventricosus]
MEKEEEHAESENLIVGQETYSDIKIKKERDRHISEMEELESQFNYEKECCRSIEDAFRTKHAVFHGLQDVAEEFKRRVSRVQEDISRIEDVLTTKVRWTV